MTTPELVMTFDPHTIEHLGVKMYSNIPTAIAELVANSYDAGASEVSITLINDPNDIKSIEVADNGIGMSFEDINNKFLRIGRNRRQEGDKTTPDGLRKATGKKGLGKLALFGLGNLISVSTIQKGSAKFTHFTLSWDELLKTKGDYKPQFSYSDADGTVQGTKILLTNIKRASPFDPESLAISLSRLFNCLDNKFKCTIYFEDKAYPVTSELRFQSITSELRWPFPDFSNALKYNYAKKAEITGLVMSTEKPLKPDMRGITLYANGRLVNAPEFFGVSESSHGFSYFTGYLNVDFVDDLEEDAISTNRQSLNWQLQPTEELREFLRVTMNALERDWREKRKEKKKNAIESEITFKTKDWFSKLPKEIKDNVEPMVQTIIEDSELSFEKQKKIIEDIHTLAPEYFYYHWRHLHPTIHDASAASYQSGDFYLATTNAAKRYINLTKQSSGSTNDNDSSMMGESFGKDNQPLKTTTGYLRPNGAQFDARTIRSIEEGQKFLSMGITQSARNPMAHEESCDLRESGLFSEKDCLDTLSILSHLFKRLDDAIKHKANTGTVAAAAEPTAKPAVPAKAP